MDLDETQKDEIYDKIRKITFYVPTDDKKRNISKKKESLERAEEFAKTF